MTKETESPNAGSKSIAASTGSLGMVHLTSLCGSLRAGLSYQGHQLKALENLVVVI